MSRLPAPRLRSRIYASPLPILVCLLITCGLASELREVELADAMCLVVQYPEKHVVILELQPPVAEVNIRVTRALHMYICLNPSENMHAVAILTS